MAGTIYIIYTNENDEAANKEEETAAYVFFSMQMILNVIGLIAILLIMFYKMDAPFVGHAHSIVDQAVLIVTLFGFYLLLGFNFLPNLESFTEPNFFGTLAKMGTFENISNYIYTRFDAVSLYYGCHETRASTNVAEKQHHSLLFRCDTFLCQCGFVDGIIIFAQGDGRKQPDGELLWVFNLEYCFVYNSSSTICIVDVLVDVWMPDKLSKD